MSLFFNRESLGEKIIRINLSRVKINRQYCALIGLKEKMFENLLIHFEKAHFEKYKSSLRKRLSKEVQHKCQIKKLQPQPFEQVLDILID